jgi:hypothetical protein
MTPCSSAVEYRLRVPELQHMNYKQREDYASRSFRSDDYVLWRYDEYFVLPMLMWTRPGLLWGPTQPPIQWVPGSFLRGGGGGVKQPGRGVNHPLPSSAEVKERVELYHTSPLWAFMSCSRTSLTFSFTFLIYSTLLR